MAHSLSSLPTTTTVLRHRHHNHATTTTISSSSDSSTIITIITLIIVTSLPLPSTPCRIYDLKGSERSRFNADAAANPQDAGEVHLDDNLRRSNLQVRRSNVWLVRSNLHGPPAVCPNR